MGSSVKARSPHRLLRRHAMTDAFTRSHKNGKASRTWISNCIQNKVRDMVTHPCPKLNKGLVEPHLKVNGIISLGTISYIYSPVPYVAWSINQIRSRGHLVLIWLKRVWLSCYDKTSNLYNRGTTIIGRVLYCYIWEQKPSRLTTLAINCVCTKLYIHYTIAICDIMVW